MALKPARPEPGGAVVGVLVLLTAFLFLFPVVMFVFGAFRTAAPGLPGAWSVRGFADAYTSPTLWPTFRNSVVLSVSVLGIATAAGLFFAWVVARTTTPLRRLVTPLMVLVFAIPPLFFALSWSMLANDPAGMLNRVWNVFNVHSWYGLIGVTALKATAAAYLLLLGPVMAIDRSIEEASFIAGAGRLRTLVRVSVPSLGPALTGPLILGFVVGIGMLDVPLILGLPAGIRVFPTEIYNYIANSTPAKYAQANALGMLLIAIVVVLVLAQRRLLSGRSFATVVGRSYRREPADIGPWKYLCAAIIVAYGLFALMLPLAQLVIGSLQPFFGVYGRWTFDNYIAVWRDPASFAAFQRTIVVGVLSGFVASAFAFAAAYVARTHRTAIARAPLGFTWLLWGVPGVTLGLAMVWAYLSVPGLRGLYATIWIVVIALIVLVTPVAARLGDGAIAQLGPELVESARMAGAGSARTFAGIVLRLVLPTFLLCWFVTGVLAAGNLDVPILMSSPTNRTVPLMVFELYNNSSLAQAAALFCILLAVIAAGTVVVAVAGLIIRRRRRPATTAREVTAAWPRSPSRV